MKQLEITTNKRLLIVEFPEMPEVYKHNKEFIFFKFKKENEYNDGAIRVGFEKIKEICKGPDLNEDIAKGFVEYDWIFKAYQYYQDTVPILGDTAINLFKVAIRNNGYYWDKPLKESFDYEKWQETESRTFNPLKCIIFEIV